MFWKPDTGLYPPHLRARIRRGMGVGERQEYKRWLNLRDVPSSGTSSSIPGIKVRRPIHTLSELETTYFYLTERLHSVVDIREQWPIFHLDETLRLCSTLGVKHPYDGAYPEPFTIDFVITELVDGKTVYRASSIKTAEDAKDPAIQQRLAVEHLWCEAHGIPWTLIDTTSFNRTVLDTLRFMRGWFRNHYVPNETFADQFAQRLLHVYVPNVVLGALLEDLAKWAGTDQQTTNDIFSYCAWSHRVPVSLKHPLVMQKPLILKRGA